MDSPISMVFERFERFKSTRLKGIRDESSKRWAEYRRIENESGSRRNYVGASRCFRFVCFRCIFDSLPCDRNGLTSMLQKAEATQSNACCSTFCPCLRQFVHCAHIILSLTGRLCQLPVWEQSWKVEISFVIPSNWLSAPEVILPVESFVILSMAIVLRKTPDLFCLHLSLKNWNLPSLDGW